MPLCGGPNQDASDASDQYERRCDEEVPKVRRVISTMSTLAVKTMLNPTSIRIAFRPWKSWMRTLRKCSRAEGSELQEQIAEVVIGAHSVFREPAVGFEPTTYRLQVTDSS